jgi:predicted nucleotidyltransferase
METPISADTKLQSKTLPAAISPEFLAELRARGVVEAHLFGSVSRGEDGPESDVDLLVRFGSPTTFFEQLSLAERLSRICGRPVEVITKLHPAFAPYILPTLVPLPL